MESSSSSNTASNSIAKKLLHKFKLVVYMLRKGIISNGSLMMDLHLLLKRGKLAGKALGKLMTFHGHHTDYSSSSFSCRSMDPNLSFYSPREVEFSCSNTPSYPVNITGRKNHHHHHHHHHHHQRSNKNYSYEYEAVAAVAKAFDMLNNNSNSNNTGEISDSESVLPSPSPVIAFGKSPAKMVRQLRITDSPFPIKEDEVADGKVDKEAEEFIRRFYEQLRMQHATPEYSRFRRGT